MRMTPLLIAAFCAASCGPVLSPVYGGACQGDKPTDKGQADSLEIARETTYFLQPKDGQGGIDYEAAINQLISDGITPESNAVVPLFRAVGRNLPYEAIDDRLFDLLGMAPPAEGEKYLMYLREVAPNLSEEEAAQLKEMAVVTPWDRRQFPELAKWIDENENPLRLVHDAVKRQHFFFPRIVSAPDSSSDEIGGLISCPLQLPQVCREIAMQLMVRAMAHSHDGQFDLAWSDLIAAHRLARLVGQGPSLIEGVISHSIEQKIFDAELVVLAQCRADTFDLKRCHDDLESLAKTRAFADKVENFERAMCLDILQTYSRGQIRSATDESVWNIFAKQSVDWNDVMRHANSYYDRVVSVMRIDDYRRRTEACRKLVDDFDKFPSPELFGNRHGEENRAELVGQAVFNTLLGTAFEYPLRMADRSEQRMRLIQVAIALRRYAIDRSGAFPDSLEELVPQYLSEVPPDLYVDMPLVYRREEAGFVLYSVGRDQEDNGGIDLGQSGNRDDLVVRFLR